MSEQLALDFDSLLGDVVLSEPVDLPGELVPGEDLSVGDVVVAWPGGAPVQVRVLGRGVPVVDRGGCEWQRWRVRAVDGREGWMPFVAGRVACRVWAAVPWLVAEVVRFAPPPRRLQFGEEYGRGWRVWRLPDGDVLRLLGLLELLARASEADLRAVSRDDRSRWFDVARLLRAERDRRCL